MDQDPRSSPFSGACLCGAVTFEITPPTRFCAHCHCSLCRRAHGAPFVTWVGVKLEQFRITRGEDKLRAYHATPDARRRFCGECGSMMFFDSERWPGEVHVARALIPGAIDRSPVAHVFYSDRADWVHVGGDGLPRLGGSTGVEPLETP